MLDLSKEFHPVPKPQKLEKSKPHPIGAGKKTIQANEDRAERKKDFVKMGIDYCEIKLPGCWKIIHGFAHVDKQNNMTPEEKRYAAIGACNPCHHKIEYECEKWTGLSMR